MSWISDRIRWRIERLGHHLSGEVEQRRVTSPAVTAQGYPDWPRLLQKDWHAWERALKRAEGGPRVLIATSVGGYSPGAILESALAVALTMEGAKVHVLLCDGILPACLQATIHQVPDTERFAQVGPKESLCPGCFQEAAQMYRSLGVTVHRYSEFVTAQESTMAATTAQAIAAGDIDGYRLNGYAVGEHAMAGALRFFARGDLEGTPHGDAILRRYLEASILTTHVAERILGTYGFECACFNHGIYVPQGLIGEVARGRGVRVVNWNPAYRKRCFIFSHDDSYHHSLLTEPSANWENIPWTEEREAELLKYLKSRWVGTHDWIWFHEKPEQNIAEIVKEVGSDPSRKWIGLLTNVIWDAQLHYRANAFRNMLDWVMGTIRYFAERPDLQLLIRIHPAEIRGSLPSHQRMDDEIRRVFPSLPGNVFIIPPESQISTYAVMERCNTVLIYGTKTGVELTSMGIPVIVGGEAWIRGKGVTRDANSAEEYFRLLDQLPLKDAMDAASVQRARKYAYHFFFRRMIPLDMIEPMPNKWPPYALHVQGLKELTSRRSRGLKVICDGVLKGTEFIYPAERFGATVA